MGTIYMVACKKCKVTRDLGKFYITGSDIENRKEMLEYTKELRERTDCTTFRAAMLTSFMSKHYGHDCIFFNEYSHDELDPFAGEYKEDIDFWNEEE